MEKWDTQLFFYVITYNHLIKTAHKAVINLALATNKHYNHHITCGDYDVDL